MLFESFDPQRGECLMIVDENGKIVRPDLEPALPESELRRFHKLLILTRTADEKALKLQRQGRLGTFASSLGQEACQVGCGSALGKEDWIFPYFRDMGLYLTVGYPLDLYFHYWMGNEAGLHTPEGLNIFPFAIPVGSQIPQAVGAGLALKYRKVPSAVLATFGDGATSEGDFHEGLNFAGVFKTPTVFVCYNNQWAISTPRNRQTASATIAQKAVAYGFPGLVVDGNDILAVHAAVAEACRRARAGDGPSLIEAYTYRMGHHTTSDDASKYRSEAEVMDWRRRDPLARFQSYLRAKGLSDEKTERDLAEEASASVETAVAAAESRPPASPDEVFLHTYKTIPPRLETQLSALKESIREADR